MQPWLVISAKCCHWWLYEYYWALIWTFQVVEDVRQKISVIHRCLVTSSTTKCKSVQWLPYKHPKTLMCCCVIEPCIVVQVENAHEATSSSHYCQESLLLAWHPAIHQPSLNPSSCHIGREILDNNVILGYCRMCYDCRQGLPAVAAGNITQWQNINIYWASILFAPKKLI